MGSIDKALLTKGDIKSLLLKLTGPMIIGSLSLVIFNLADTYFVGWLGTEAQAALSYTFPVVLVINSLALGMGMGASSVVANAIGSGNRDQVRRLMTDALLLSMVIVVVFSTAGLFTIRPIFTLLGAKGYIYKLVRQYMTVWYIGMPFAVMPMVGNNIIRATGDTKTPSVVMLIAAVTNIILDPLLITGAGFFPRLEIVGAALATVAARMITFAAAIYVLARRERLILFKSVALLDIWNSWQAILRIGVPNALSKMIIPIASGIITGLISSYGYQAVAGFGVATRFEQLMLSPVNALSAVIIPFVGQNYGAKKWNAYVPALPLPIKYPYYSALAPMSCSLFLQNQLPEALIRKRRWCARPLRISA